MKHNDIFHLEKKALHAIHQLAKEYKAIGQKKGTAHLSGTEQERLNMIAIVLAYISETALRTSDGCKDASSWQGWRPDF